MIEALYSSTIRYVEKRCDSVTWNDFLWNIIWLIAAIWLDVFQFIMKKKWFFFS